MKRGLLSGKAIIEIRGLGAERFINICHHHEIFLYEIKAENDNFIAEIKASDFLKTKHIIKTTGVRIKILSKSGLPFWYFKNRKRYIFALGIVIFLFIILCLTRFIWKIDINGNLFYSDESILEFLSDNDVIVGCKINKIDETSLEELIRKEYDKIIWVSVSVNGTKLSIDVKENDTNPLMEEQNVVNDIIASKDGIISSITVRRGTPIVSLGDEVKKGDVLVTSKVECANESGEVVKTVYTNADAEILIDTVYEYEEVIERNYQVKEYTGNVQEKQITRLGNKMIENLYFKCDFENYDVFVDYEHITTSKNFIFPIFYGYVYYREYKLVDKSYSDEELTRILEENLSDYIDKLQENSIQINTNSVKIDISGYSGRAYGTINVTEPAIEYQEPIIIEEEENPEGTD